MRYLLALFLPFSLFAVVNIEGTWSTDCLGFGRHAMIATMEVKQKTYHTFVKLFETEKCAKHTVRAKLSAKYETGESFGNGYIFNHQVKNVEMKLQRDDVVEHYNFKKICNFDDWQLQKYKNISGAKNCVGFSPPTINVPYYDLFRKIFDNVQFSWFPANNFNTNLATRPTYIAPINSLFWKVSETTFNRVKRDLNIYEKSINESKKWFAGLNKDISDKNWVKFSLDYMVDIDQFMRNYHNIPADDFYSESEKKYFKDRFNPQFADLDKYNTELLKEILQTHEWVKISEFGEKADADAWLIAQHADRDPKFQRKVLMALGKLWRIGETRPKHYAYLHDRICASWANPKKQVPQRYGTQGRCVAPGDWRPIPIEDATNVDKRRAEVGLEPLNKYIEKFKNICK